MFSIRTMPELINLKPQQLPVILDLCLRKIGAGISHNSRDTISFSKTCSVLKMFSVLTATKAGVRFEERFQKLRSRDGLVWTVGLTVEIKLRFQIFLALCPRSIAKDKLLRKRFTLINQ